MASANIIRVNTESLDQTRKELQTKLNKIRKDMEQISEDMNTLNSMWSRDAHTAFAKSVTQDISLLTETCSGLQSIITYESTAVTEYRKCENQVSEMISQIGI